MIISAFPGTGKTYLATQNPDLYVDLESSIFQYGSAGSEGDKGRADRVRNPEWPDNYVQEILTLHRMGKVVFISMHKEVQDAVRAAGVEFIAVVPDVSLKEEYVRRWTERGNNPAFVSMMAASWEGFIASQLENTATTLQSGQYLGDVMPALLCGGQPPIE